MVRIKYVLWVSSSILSSLRENYMLRRMYEFFALLHLAAVALPNHIASFLFTAAMKSLLKHFFSITDITCGT